MMEAFGAGLGIGVVLCFMCLGIYMDIRQERMGRRADKVKARILLLSDDPKEIEKYLVEKENIIGVDLTNQLLNRLAEIKADKALDWDRNATKQVEKA